MQWTWDVRWPVDTCLVERFLARFQPPPLAWPALCGSVLRKIIKKQCNKAPGPDGWSAIHLCRLPPGAFDLLARVFELIERTGLWPDPLTAAQVSLIPKPGEDLDAQLQLKARPLTVFSTAYRAWSTARARHLAQRAASWTPAAFQACLPCRDGRCVWKGLALQLEFAQQTVAPLSGFLLVFITLLICCLASFL